MRRLAGQSYQAGKKLHQANRLVFLYLRFPLASRRHERHHITVRPTRIEKSVTVGEKSVTVGGKSVTVGEKSVTVGGKSVTVGGKSVTVGGPHERYPVPVLQSCPREGVTA